LTLKRSDLKANDTFSPGSLSAHIIIFNTAPDT